LSRRKQRDSILPVRIRAENLVKKFGWATALDDVSWEIEPGQIVAVLGSNGAGKTTLLETLAGVSPPDCGQVLMDGEPYRPDRDDLRRRFAYIPDIPPAPGFWTPLRFIATLLKLYQTPTEGLQERVVELLEAMDLLGVARWELRRLSRGQMYKSILAGFIAADPEVWFVDEPFSSGMDPRGLDTFKHYAREATKRGRTIVFTTQIIEVAEQFADTVCVLDHGKIQACTTSAELRESSAFADLAPERRGDTAG
jgi:ABC-2 type transport system ATP-binding protein